MLLVLGNAPAARRQDVGLTMDSPAFGVFAPALAGAALGSGIAWALPAPADSSDQGLLPPAAIEVVLERPLPMDCPDRQQVWDKEEERLTLELKGVALQLTINEHRRVAREGIETPWPDSPDPLQSPDTLKKNLQTALSNVGGDVLEMECDEYPCIVAVALPKDDGMSGIAGTAMDDLYEGLNDHGYLDPELVWSTTTEIDGDYVSVFAIRGPDDSDIQSKRASFRGERFSEETFERLREEAP